MTNLAPLDVVYNQDNLPAPIGSIRFLFMHEVSTASLDANRAEDGRRGYAALKVAKTVGELLAEVNAVAGANFTGAYYNGVLAANDVIIDPNDHAPILIGDVTNINTTEADDWTLMLPNKIYTRGLDGSFTEDAPAAAGDTVTRGDTGATGTFDGVGWIWALAYTPIDTSDIDINQSLDETPYFVNHDAATRFYLSYWKGAQSGGDRLPLKVGLSYTDGTHEYRSVAASTTAESWIAKDDFNRLTNLTEGMKAQLAALVSTNGPLTLDSANGLVLGLDQNAVNAGQLNGQTAAQIIASARDRMSVYRVYSLIDPDTDAIPSEAGRRFVTTGAGNSLNRITVYEIQNGVPVEITALVPGDYVLEENDPTVADKSWIVKTHPDTQQFTLFPSGEGELSAAQLALILLLETFGGQRMVDLLTALESFGVANLRGPEQIRQIAEAEVDILEAVLASLTAFGVQRAVDLLTALEAKGIANLVTISQMNNAIANFYAERNIVINFDPTKGSPDPASGNYLTPFVAPLANMTVSAKPDGFSRGLTFKNHDKYGPSTEWFGY